MSLSDKIEKAKEHLARENLVNAWWAVRSLQDDIKEFIQKIKEKIDNPMHEVECNFSIIEGIIDEEAGDKLT